MGKSIISLKPLSLLYCFSVIRLSINCNLSLVALNLSLVRTLIDFDDSHILSNDGCWIIKNSLTSPVSLL